MNSSQVRVWLASLGVGLGILWLATLGGPGGAGWIGWLDFVGALLSFAGAAATTPSTEPRVRSGGTLALSSGVFGIWLIGLTNAGVASWLVWWNFAFACAYLIVGFMAGARRSGEVQTRMRRAA